LFGVLNYSYAKDSNSKSGEFGPLWLQTKNSLKKHRLQTLHGHHHHLPTITCTYRSTSYYFAAPELAFVDTNQIAFIFCMFYIKNCGPEKHTGESYSRSVLSIYRDYYIPTTDIRHKIIHKRSSQNKRKEERILLICTYIQIVENWKPIWLLITIIAKCTTQEIYIYTLMYVCIYFIAYLFLNCWNSEKFNLELQNLVV
jgi:hypothetical protein